jgi:hypothetical protein
MSFLARNERVASAFAVESRSGAVTVYPFRFQIPLIKPDMRISRISAFGPRSIHAFAHGKLCVVCSNRTSPSVS